MVAVSGEEGDGFLVQVHFPSIDLLVMRGSISLIHHCSAKLKLILQSEKISRPFSSGNSAAMCFSMLNDETSISYDEEVLPKKGCISAVNIHELEFHCGDHCSAEEVFLFYEYQKSEEFEMESMKMSDTNCEWIQGCEKLYWAKLNQIDMARGLDKLFDQNSKAALAVGLKNGIQATCKLIHIFASRNMNHTAARLISYLVRTYHGQKDSSTLLLDTFLDTCKERRVLKTVYSMLIDCYVKEDMLKIALEASFKGRLLRIFPSAAVCNSLLQALLRSNQSNLAWDFLEEMQSQGIGMNASIISVFINHYCNKGDIRSAWKLVTEMKNYGIKADMVAYSIIVHHLCRMSWLKEGTCLLFKILQMGFFLDSVVINSVIDGYCKVGNLGKAIHILSMCNLPLDNFLYNSFLTKLCRDCDMSDASKLFLEMPKVGLRPDCYNYTTMIQGYCKAGDIKRALQYFGKMLKSGNRPSITTYAVLIDMNCQIEDMGMAEHMFQIMITDGLVPDVVVCNTLMHLYGKNGCLHKVFKLLGLMTTANISPDIITYNTIIHSLMRNGFVNEAREILDELVQRGFSPDVVTFTSVIDGFARRGNFEEAFLMWSSMQVPVQPDIITCSALLSGYCRARRMEEAYALFRKMLDAGLRPDLILYNTLIHGFCKIGCVEDACYLVNMMVQGDIYPNDVTHRALILGFEKKRFRNPAEAAHSKLQEILAKNGIYIGVDAYLSMVNQRGRCMYLKT
ncbi:hypothetical protein BT93_E0931 [Corymbia citriodora subsp. variegata]|nr:hypothetical protein BT93_E0931 [Corymbia citriodora subsp. variegata]